MGNSVGGAQDDWGRFVAQYLGKHIPGNPDIVVQNMPGAGTVIAANYVYSVAKPDGLTLGLINPAIYIDQLLGAKEVKFDWPKFSWIGSRNGSIRSCSSVQTLLTRHWKIFVRAAEPPKCAALARTGLGYFYRSSLRRGLGLRFIW